MGLVRHSNGYDIISIKASLGGSKLILNHTSGAMMMGDPSLPRIDGPLRNLMAQVDLRELHREERILRIPLSRHVGKGQGWK